MKDEIVVVKVGGSLYDLPDLGPRLRRWLAPTLPSPHLGEGKILPSPHLGEGRVEAARVLVVPGGGPLADAIRNLDRRHGLGEETSHWLALRALSVNAHFLASLLPSVGVYGDIGEIRRAWENNLLPILDPHEFARGDEGRPHHLSHSWAVTSDALAARVAVVFQARRLILLKSATIPQDVDWREAGRRGWVDEMFAEVLRQAPADLHVHAVNLRLSA